MKPDEISKYSESFKNIIIALSIIIGGMWALYVFNAKLEVQSARAKLESLNQQLITRAVILPSISTSVIKSESDNAWYVINIVTLENKGNTDASIGFEKDALIIARAEFDKGNVIAYHDHIRNPVSFIYPENYLDEGIKESEVWLSDEGIVLSGQKKVLHFVSKIQEVGLYRIQFIGLPGSNIREVRKNVIEKPNGVPIITVSDYILIEGDPNNAN